MNKQELIKCYENTCCTLISINGVLEDLRQLDEPKKVTVPQFVADWIEKCKAIKKFIPSLAFAINSEVWSENNLSDECIDWLYNANNQETFARAWLDGYEVEEEKRYYVRLKHAGISNSLLKRTPKGEWWFGINFNDESQAHTLKELEEAGFGEVFNSPLFEVKEVEE